MRDKRALSSLLWCIAVILVSLSLHTISCASTETVSKNPQSILDEMISLNDKAEAFRESGEYTNAVQYYLEACKLIESNEALLPYEEYKNERIVCYWGLGFCYYSLEEYETAADFLSRIDTNRTYWEWNVSDAMKLQYYSLYADIHLKLNEKEKAEDCYIMLNRLNDPALSVAANLFTQKRYREVIEIKPENTMNVKVWLYKAKSWQELGNYEEAIGIYNLLIDDHLRLLTELYVYKEIFPEALKAFYSLGKQYRDLKDDEKAIAAFRSGLDKVKAYESVSKDDLTITREKSDLLFEYAYTYYIRQEYKEAAEAFRSLEEHINPSRINVGNIRGFSDFFGNLTSREAIDFYLFYAISLEKNGNPDEARVLYVEANKYYKKHPDETFKKGEAAFTEGNITSAIGYFEESLIERPLNMEAYFYIAKAYYSLGKMEQAMKTVDYILNENLVAPEQIRVFKSTLLQTGEDYQNAAREGETLPGSDLKRKLTFISLLAFLSFVSKTLFTFFKKRQYRYSYALAPLYDEINRLNTLITITNETEVDTTGIEL